MGSLRADRHRIARLNAYHMALCPAQAGLKSESLLGKESPNILRPICNRAGRAGHFGHIDVDLHVQCISYRLVFGPSGPISRKHTFCRRVLLFKEATGNLNFAPRSEPGDFWATLVSLWGYFGRRFFLFKEATGNLRFASTERVGAVVMG